MQISGKASTTAKSSITFANVMTPKTLNWINKINYYRSSGIVFTCGKLAECNDKSF